MSKSILRKSSIALSLSLWGALAVSAQPGTEGHVNYLEYAESWFDTYTASPTYATQQWFQANFYGMVVWSPYFDSKTSWFPNAFAYIDLYGIPVGSWITYAHPEWILKDQYGNWLYLSFGCANGACTQWAADVGNPAFRAWWISQAQSLMAAGNYPGIFMDDTNMLMRVSDGYYNPIPPIDSNTGAPMSYNAWRYYIAQFTSQVRAAMPYATILENCIWYAGPPPAYDQDPYIQQQLKTATKINLERGIASDPGLTGGTGFWSVYNFFSYVDRVHALGTGVNFEEYQLNSSGQEYGLASYFMISNGTDSLGDKSVTPYNWFNGYSVDLGPALGPRTYNNGVFQRNFARGIALMGEPSLAAQTVSLPGWYQRLDGTWVNSVTLSGWQGVILQGGNTPPPAPPSTLGGGGGGGSWISLGGSFSGKPSVGQNSDGRLEAFVRGGDGQVWHAWQNTAGGGWSGWSALGGQIASNPVVAANADGRLEVFAQGADNALWTIWQTAPGGSWSGWTSLGGTIQSDPALAANSDGRLEVFVQGGDSGLWTVWQYAPNGSWSGWASLGGTLVGRPSVAINSNGSLEVFARGGNNALWTIWQTSAGGGWSAWSSLQGGISSNPAVAANSDGRLEVMAVGADGALWDIHQTSASGSWSAWTTLAGAVSSNPSMAANSDGRLEVFLRGMDNSLWTIWQSSLGGPWSPWASLGGALAGDQTVSRNSDGRLQVFARGTDNALWTVAQSVPAGAWN